MTSTLRSLIERIYPSARGSHRVVIGGLDYTGKTTLLYLLKMNELVTTIPSIGFNVETVDITTSPPGNKQLRLDMWDVGSGCGGPSLMIRMLRWYLPGAKALVWMVDSTDVRGEETIKEGLQVVLSDVDALPEMADRHIPILILANKSDKPNATSLDDIRILFSTALRGRLFGVFSTSLTSTDLKATGVQAAFDWLSLALEIADTTKKSGSEPAPSVAPVAAAATPTIVHNPRDPSLLAKRLGEWLQRTETDSPPEVFMLQFNAFDLPSWDHYAHIRLAFLILVYHGRQNGKNLIFSGIQSYLANNATSQTNARKFHFTMTYFWIQIVHFGIQNLPANILPPLGTSVYPSTDDFFRFLMVNPHVTDGGLWMDYYTKDAIMSATARDEMVLPDRKPLPSVVARDAVQGFGAK